MKGRAGWIARLLPGAALLTVVCFVGPVLFLDRLGRIAGLLP